MKALNLKRSINKPADIIDAIRPISPIFATRPVLRQAAAKSIAAHLDIRTLQDACKAVHGGVNELTDYIDREVMRCL